MSMSLMLAIVQPQDAKDATTALTQAGLRVTQISSMGGFLQTGNVTLLLGLERRQIAQTGKLLATHCHKRTVLVNAAIQEAGHLGGLVMPLEAQVGGAVMFALPVERYMHLGEPGKEDMTMEHTSGPERMKLVMAIVPEENSRAILDALMDAQYRVTLISTTGGFWRKGNATLLIGVPAAQVDDVLNHIQDVCATCDDASKAWATLFVLDVEQHQHI